MRHFGKFIAFSCCCSTFCAHTNDKDYSTSNQDIQCVASSKPSTCDTPASTANFCDYTSSSSFDETNSLAMVIMNKLNIFSQNQRPIASEIANVLDDIHEEILRKNSIHMDFIL